MIVIINYGTGNSASIKKMIQKLDPFIEVKYADSIEDVKAADKVILPGVGAFDTGMRELKRLNLINLLREKALYDKVPFLGICLGMQLLMESSEEGSEKGLGLIKGGVKKFQLKESSLPVPHMGWNFIKVIRTNPLIPLNERLKFYFVHSYFVSCDKEENILAKAKYGHEFDAAIQSENIFGVQFHPEKSHLFGEDLLKKFLEL